jgi:hypothetical protein
VDQLATLTNLSKSAVQAALRQLCSAGRVMFDLEIGKYRLRELTRDPLPVDELKYANPREEKADQLVQEGKVSLEQRESLGDDGVVLRGKVAHEPNPYTPEVLLDADGRIQSAKCSCYFYNQNRLMQGPCEHMMAILRLYRMR